ncbi:hypothetical protein BV898_05539 [Hypsibius exemplaris]|uniref:CID domain-containing protein n=1 Tax=Hypsibius exemplaris TaxID=2072580 RepID=A0A1W0WZ63_HYPEX|nr:hypothetical protein BV898_05539 [Hypsibius exemplaris]
MFMTPKQYRYNAISGISPTPGRIFFSPYEFLDQSAAWCFVGRPDSISLSGMTVMSTYHQPMTMSHGTTMDADVQEGLESYRDSLKDLNNLRNNKPLINMLTMLAEESQGHGSLLVDVIEDHIRQIGKTEAKLAALLLIDSILKNVQGTLFKDLFRGRIIAIVSHIFQQTTDEEGRKLIYRLRLSWQGLFNDCDQVLVRLDNALREIDHKWPVVIPAAPSAAAPVVPMVHPLQKSVNTPPPQPQPPRTVTSPSTLSETAERPETDAGIQNSPAVAAVTAKRNDPPVRTGPRKARTEVLVSQAKPHDVSVSMDSLEPPKGKRVAHPAAAAVASVLSKAPTGAKAASTRPKPAAAPLKEPISDPVALRESHPREPEPRSLPAATESASRVSPGRAEEVRKPTASALPRIPKKSGATQGRSAKTPTEVVAPARKRPLAISKLPTDVSGAGRDRPAAPMGRIPKRKTDSGDGMDVAPNRKQQKIVGRPDERPPPFVEYPYSVPRGRRPGPNRGSGPIRPAFTRHTAPVRGMDQTRHPHTGPRSHPYQQQKQQPPPRGEHREPYWEGPPNYLPPPMDSHFVEFDQPSHHYPRHPGPLLPTPPMLPSPLPPVIMVDEAVRRFEAKMEEAREKVRRGILNEAARQQLEMQARRDLELDQLADSVERSRRGILLPGTPRAFINETEYETQWYDGRPVVLVDGSIFDIGFTDSSKPVLVIVDGNSTGPLRMAEEREVFIGNGFHKIRFGGPNYELVVEGQPYRCVFGGSAVPVFIDGADRMVQLDGPAPRVTMGSVPLNGQIFGGNVEPVETPSAAAPAAPVDFLSMLTPELKETLRQMNLNEKSEKQPERIETASSESPYRRELRKRLELEAEREKRTILDSARADFLPFRAINEENCIYLDFLEKLHLSPPAGSADHMPGPMAEGYRPSACCAVCAQRSVTVWPVDLKPARKPDSDEDRLRHATLHRCFRQQIHDNMHIADWLLDEAEFTGEKSREVDTTPQELKAMFAAHTASQRITKPVEVAADGAFGGANGDTPSGEAGGDDDFAVRYCPVVDSGRRRLCQLCQDQMEIEDNEDGDGWLLKDGVQVTAKSGDCAVHEYHRDCFDQNRESIRKDLLEKTGGSTVSATVTAEKPRVEMKAPVLRWGAAQVDDISSSSPSTSATVALKPAPLSSDRQLTATVRSTAGILSSERRSSVTVISPPTNSSSAVDQSSEFVIQFGDDEDDEDDYYVEEENDGLKNEQTE